ncbi:MAG: hypothetical protein CSA51_03055 [Gammaproteobacteria bacterium]|nr:MAG: hypothetical protein CSA51_03055 [Gammaproteobacteria bacterium]
MKQLTPRLMLKPTALTLAIVSLSAYNPGVIAAEPTHKDSASRGAMDDDRQVFVHTFQKNQERQLSVQHYTLWGAVSDGPAQSAKRTAAQERTAHPQALNFRFASGLSDLETAQSQAIANLIAQLREHNIVKVRLTGHTDSRSMSKRTKSLFKSNYNLGLERARSAAELLKARLSLQDDQIEISSEGPNSPIADNKTKKGRALNRRVELTVWYQAAPEPVVACSQVTDSPSAFQISVDGQPVQDSNKPTGADQQRCEDLRLADNDIQLRYDNRNLDKRLNVSSSTRHITPGSRVSFQGYSNYLFWLESAEVLIFDQRDKLIAQVPLNAQLQGEWINDQDTKGDLFYQLRVYDGQKHYDETEKLPLWVVAEQPEASKPEELAGYGESRLIRERIPVDGGIVTVNVKNLNASDRLYIFGQSVPVDEQGNAVAQQILPEGGHRVEVLTRSPDQGEQRYLRHLAIADDDWFVVGLADLTLGRNSTTSAAELLNPDNHHYKDGKTYLDGRLAFYVKGPLNERYTLTASADTGEEKLSRLLSSLDEKNPRALLRRLDTTRHWPTFGDGSSLVEDAPTQGKLYAKIESERSQIMWGNFKTSQKDTKLTQVERSLYGARVKYNSAESTGHDEPKTKAEVFVAEPGTISTRDSFRGTGGSLYFLRHQDITTGSEQVRIEVRDEDSGEVISSEALAAGNDYDIDAIQGRILLSKPLLSTVNNSQLVQSGSLSGHAAYLVVSYEYTPGTSDLSDMASSGRVSHWVNDKVKVGITASNQELDGNRQRLHGVDLTYRKSDRTQVSVEIANTKGRGFREFRSDDGGYTFTEQTQTGESAVAGRIDGRFAVSDLTGDEEAKGEGHFYIESREKGFSAPGRLTDTDTVKAGVGYRTELSDTSGLSVEYDEIQTDASVDKQTVEVDYDRKLDENWKVGVGLRHDKQSGSGVDSGTRDDVAVKLTHSDSPGESTWGFVQGSVNRSDARQRNNRIGVGAERTINEKAKASGEISGGNQGLGAKLGVDYQWSDDTSLYVNYSSDSDDLEKGGRSRNGQFVSGMRSQLSNDIAVYAEGRVQTGDQPGLMQSYGVDYSPSEKWNYGASMELGELNQDTSNEIDRVAVTGSVSYKGDDHRYAGALEYRKDETQTEERTTWLARNNYSTDINDDWKGILRLDMSFSDSSLGNEYDGKYVEGSVGYAYRPVYNDELNLLFKYTYLYDLAAAEQLTPSETGTVDYAQRSHVLAVDGTYDLTPKWSIGGKYAYRLGELRYSRDNSADWFSSRGELLILRTDWHVVKEWDALLEWRYRRERAANDSRSGFLGALYRHVNENVKVGVGYNDTDFNDDVTDLNYNARGYFINLIGKY